jgi:hypothetical protein
MRIRRLFTFLSLASLATCATLCVSWAGSMSASNGPTFGLPFQPTTFFYISDGTIGIVRLDMIRLVPGHFMSPRHLSPNRPQPTRGGSLAGFKFYTEVLPDCREFRVAIPAWAMIIGSLALAALFWFRRPPIQPCNAVLCRACGYDLRATLARCPECGTAANEAGANWR